MSTAAPALELRGIDKRFGRVTANAGVDLLLNRGEIHALVGENGAGKSTLMKIAYGLIAADAGEIRIKGKAVPARYGPRQAIDAGVGMVHQHFMLVPTLRVAENVMLGREPTRGGLLDAGRVISELRELQKRHGIDVDPHAVVEELSVGEQQRVEILKVLWRGADVLILDEPTAVLTPAEVARLFEVLRSLAAAGVTIVMITHKLDEVLDIADRVTVMRRGERVAGLEGEAITAEAIVQAMIGRPVLLEVERGEAAPGDVALQVNGITIAGRGDEPVVRNLSFQVRAGEILGIAGVQGNGQTELVDAIAGLRPISRGTMQLGKTDITVMSVAARQALGLAHIPEDRHARGLVLDFTVGENFLLGEQRRFSGRLAVDADALAEHGRGLIEGYDVRPANLEARAGALSGGNQQKVVVARELSRIEPRALLCAQPTRGVDVGAIELIHRRLIAARDQGLAIVLVSAELSELRALADRIIVMYEGRIAGELDASALAEPGAFDAIGHLMTGSVGAGPAEEDSRE